MKLQNRNFNGETAESGQTVHVCIITATNRKSRMEWESNPHEAGSYSSGDIYKSWTSSKPYIVKNADEDFINVEPVDKNNSW